MKQKLLFLFFAFLSITLTKAQTFTAEGIKYNVTDATNNKVEVAQQDSNTFSGEANIPATVTDPGTNSTYAVTSIGNKAFFNCASLTSILIPSSVISIGDNAFNACLNLPSVTIPSSVETIGELAFAGCSDLKSVTVLNPTPVNINANVFENITLANVLLIVPSGSKADYKNAPVWKDFKFPLPPSFTIDDLTYTPISENSVSVKAANTTLTSASILSTVTIEAKEFSVTTIETNAFKNCNKMVSVTIPSSVTTIGDYAFGYCTDLTAISIPTSVTSIGVAAFSYCDGLTSVTIPSGVTLIQADTFRSCSQLTSVTLPNTITSIGDGAFSGCSVLNAITIPNSVTTIGEDAFGYCTGLTALSIPNSVTSIGAVAFYGCTGLTSMTIPSSVTTIKFGTFDGCSGLTSLTIQDAVTSIEGYAFNSCSGLTSITIPSSVTTIGESAFGDCTALTSVTVLNPTPVNINANVFNNVTIANVTLNVPTGTRTAYKNAAVWQNFKFPPAPTSFTIDNLTYTFTSATTVSVKAANTTLTAAIIPEIARNEGTDYTVTAIEVDAFKTCTALTNVTIPSSIISIGSNAFNGCTGLIAVKALHTTPLTIDATVFSGVDIATIPLSVPTGKAFDYMSKDVWKGFKFQFTQGDLTYTPISENTVSVKAANKTLTSATILGNVTNDGSNYSVTIIEVDGFKACTALTNVTIPSTISSIGSNAFNGCTGLTAVKVLHTTPLTIDATVFSGVNTAAIPLSVPVGKAFTYMSALIWKNFKLHFTQDNLTYTPTSENTVSVKAANKTLTSATILGNVTNDGSSYSVTNIEVDGFNGCSNLASVTIPNTVTKIGSYAFANCTNLASATIGNAVSTIEEGAFTICSKLTTITIPKSVASIGSYAFGSCSGLTSVTVLNSTPVAINANVFNQVTIANVLLNVPAGTRAAYKAAAVWKDFKFPLPPAFTIGYLIYTPTSDTTVSVKWDQNTIDKPIFGIRLDIPASVDNNGSTFSVTVIEDNAFSDSATFIYALTIPNSVIHIGASAFERIITTLSTDQISLTIPNSVKSIGNKAFKECYMSYLTLPSSLTSIGNSAFEGCVILSSVTVLNPNPIAISPSVFTGFTNIVSLKVPAGSENSYRNAAVWKDFFKLSYQDGLLSYTINSDNTVSVRATDTNIGQDVIIPTTIVIKGISYPVKSIEKGGFAACKNIKTFTAPKVNVGDYAFLFSSIKTYTENNNTGTLNYSKTSASNKTSTTTTTSETTSIGTGAFSGCVNLESFKFSENTTSIGELAFEGCTGLTAVTALPTTPININANVFDGVTIANIPLTVAAGSENLYSNASVWKDFKSVITLSASDFELEKQVMVYPNPSSGIFNIQTKEDALLEVYDVTGRIIKTQKATSENTQLDLSALNNGIFFLKTNQGSAKLIKK